MMKQIIISTILSLLFLVQSVAQNTTISGEIKNPNVYSIGFSWEKDLVSGVVKESIIALNGANEFSSVIDIDEPSIIHIKYGSKSKDVFVEPGNNLEINFDANQFDYSFTFSGTGKENNKLLDYYGKEFGKYSDNFFIYEMAHKSNGEFRTYMDGIHQQMWNFYQQNSISGISYHFRNYLKADIEYRWAYNLLRYRFENPKANLKPGPIVLPKNYYTFLDQVQIQNPNGLKNKEYHKFIDEYLQYRKDRGSEALKKFTVRVESNSLTLRDEPKTGEKIGVVNNGEILEYLKDQSTITSEVFTRGKKITTPWIKVRTSSGQMGWVIKGGVDFIKTSDDTSLGSLAKSGKYNNAGKHFKGEVLEFYIAKELHKSVRDSSLPYAKSDFESFLGSARNQVFKASVQNDFTTKFGSSNNASLVNNTNPGRTNASRSSTTLTPKSVPSPSKQVNVKRSVPRSTNYVIGIPKNTELRGKVLKPTSRAVEVVFYKDKFSFEEKSLRLPLSPNDEFDLSFDISEPTVAKLIYNNSEIEFFIEPGDQLGIEFTGNAFSSSITFTGKCGEQNNFLSSFNKEFAQYDDDHIYNEIVNKKHTMYRFHLDNIRRKKWNFLHQYGSEAKGKFSRGFSKYIAAEIDYWWAYNLLRYHWEHPAANGLAYPMKIDGNYYNFLGKVMISNDDAIASKSYLSFLNLYLKLREDNPSTNILNQIKQGTYKSFVQNEEVMNTPGGNGSLTVLFNGEKVKYLDVKSPNTTRKMVNGIMKTDYWYQVGTNDGYTGWVFGSAGTLDGVEDKNAAVSKKYKTVEEEKEVVTTYAIVQVDRLRIRKEPDLPSAVGLASEGMQLKYLGRKSSQRYTFTLRGRSYNDYFYKIEAPDGKVGWVFGGGIELQEVRSKQKIYKTVPIEQATISQTGGSTEMYLTGRALYYTKASDIYWKCKGSKPSDIKKEVDRFVNTNPYKEYDTAIEEAYNDALRREYNVTNAETLAAEKAEAERKKKAAAQKAKEEAERIAEEKRQKEIQRKKDEEIRKQKEADNIARIEKEREEAAAAAAKAKAEADAEAEKIARENEIRLAKEKEEAEIAAAQAAAQAEADRIKREKEEALAEKKRIADEKAAKKAAKQAAKQELADKKAKEKADRIAAQKEADAEKAKEKEELAEQRRKEKEAKIAQRQKEREEELAAIKKKADEEAARKKAQDEAIAAKQKSDSIPDEINVGTNLTSPNEEDSTKPDISTLSEAEDPFKVSELDNVFWKDYLVAFQKKK